MKENENKQSNDSSKQEEKTSNSSKTLNASTTNDQAKDKSQSNTPIKKWYREPWPWILIALPGIVVVGCMVTMYFAFTTKDTLVTDDYYKDGKNIHLQMERDQRAALLNISADVFVQPDGKGVMVITKGDYDKRAKLNLLFFHPTLQERDRSVELVQSKTAPNQYTGTFKHALPVSPSWKVRLEDENHVWRLEKRWVTAEGDSIHMSPYMKSLENKTLLEKTKQSLDAVGGEVKNSDGQEESLQKELSEDIKKAEKRDDKEIAQEKAQEMKKEKHLEQLEKQESQKQTK